MGKIRGTHSSPGIYSQITDLSYAAKTLGVTTLGLVGETVKGPAFEPIMISDYTQYQEYFGNCSAERFKDSLYPKYETSYIAKSYLSKSDRLYVCRVLGLSGYNAGPAFIITAESAKENKEPKTRYVVAVLRSRGSYVKYANIGTACKPISKYDQLIFDCDKIEIEPYVNASVLVNCDEPIVSTGTTEDIEINALTNGQFTIVAKKYNPESEYAGEDGYEVVGRYPVSLNSGTKDYIFNVLGSKPTEGSAAVFVEELYDLRLRELIEKGLVTRITKEVSKIAEIEVTPVCDPVRDFVKIPANGLKRKYLAQTFLCAVDGDLVEESETYNGFGYFETTDNGEVVGDLQPMKVGRVYKVKSYTSPETGVKSYVYVELKETLESGEVVPIKVGEITSTETVSQVNAVNVMEYDSFFAIRKDVISGETYESLIVVNNMADYHEQFRCASTPWFVSELKGDAKDLQVKKLFRFHTITDGTQANTQVKISIANVSPDAGTFDVYVRDYNDSDGNVKILESYRGVTMVPGDSKYVGLQIGTLDGAYELKSKYVMIEIIENDMTMNCVPCGFVGYPVRQYGELVAPTFTYQRFYDDDVKEKRQYFGLTDGTNNYPAGVDVDMLTYKGRNAYTEDYVSGYTHGFHLDSTLSEDIKQELLKSYPELKITIDGDPDTADMIWDAVSPNNVTEEGKSPIIGSEQDMAGTIYEDGKLRKFTAYFYGGFDGWDAYRNSRTNTDEFRANKYKGTITNGYGKTFSKIQNGTNLALPANSITSDYYAYLAGINQFEIPEKYLINLFATPGIDYVNHTLLVGEVLDMLEDKRKDTFYVVTTPDKPWGSSDAIDEMYSSSDVSENLEDVSIDTYIASTYYPWIKYYDSENNIYINLPATKDVLRNMADVDNKKYPWFAPAGIERGNVECTKMHFFAKLEDEDNVYDGRINPLKTFSKDGVKVWGNKTMYSKDTPMNRINTVRLMLYMKKLIVEATRSLIFEPNDTTLLNEFDSIVRPILQQIKTDRGITDFRLTESQTPEQMDAHEISASIYVKPTPTLEYIELDFVVTPQGVSFDEI